MAGMKVLDLFSGIGGFSLGLEAAGMETVAFCEIEPFPRSILRRHWPNVPCYDDIRTLTAARLSAAGISVDVICGGFPCQDISNAGKMLGIGGERSGLWKEYARLIGEVRPRYVIVENVAALLGRGLGEVLGDLAALGYDAVWNCIPASAVGAPHRRDRIWIVAYAQGDGRDAWGPGDAPEGQGGWQSGGGCVAADVAHPHDQWELQSQGVLSYQRGWVGNNGWWGTEPDVGRVAYGVPSRVDRLKSLGNAVVPQIPEMIGRAIMRLECPQ